MKETHSWKEKIDPHFDKPVKTYIRYLSQIENLPDDGHIRVCDNFAELICKHPNFTASYRHEFKEETVHFNKDIGLWNDQEYKLFLDILNSFKYCDKILKLILNKSGFIRIISRFITIFFYVFFIRRRIILQMKSLVNLARKLNEVESREYYINRITGFLNDIHERHFFRFMNDFAFTTFSLFLRSTCVKIDKIHETEATTEKKEYLNNPIGINQIVGFYFSTISQIAHQQDMSELIGNISKNDDKSIFKALVIDKGLINYEPIVNRINKANVSGDKTFLKKLSKAMTKGPLKRVGQHGKTYAVLKLFWKMDL